jgi:hypothetical protein
VYYYSTTFKKSRGFHVSSQEKNENRELLLVSGREIRRTKKPLVGEKMLFLGDKRF